MPYISKNYAASAVAPEGKWVCAPSSSKEPYDTVPAGDVTKGRDLCGQCVSYVKSVCPTLPGTAMWRKGEQVKGNTKLAVGTVIATFNAHDQYEGHAAIYTGQTNAGINVYDQYITPPSPKPVGARLIRFGGGSRSNNGDAYFVVE